MTQANRPSGRIFPVATPTLYAADATATTESERAGQAVLALARGAFTRFARVAAVRLSPVRRLGRLLLVHRLALDAEVRQMPRRADFFWREAIRQLEALWRDDRAWSAVIASHAIQPAAAGTAMTADRLQTALLRELFADTHWAFYQTHHGADADPDNRGFVHLDYLLQLVTRTSALDAARMDALAHAMRGFAGTCLQHRRGQRAEQAAAVLIERFGDGEEHQNLLATAICRRAIDELKHGDDEAAAKHNAEAMKAVAKRLETLRDRFGTNALLFDLLAGIHFRRAVALANSGQLADALVAIHKALAFDPALDGAGEARNKLIQMMNELRQQAQTIEAKVAATPNATLNQTGRQMVREAARGFEPLNAFIDSAEAARIVADWRIVQGRAIWRALGLSPAQASKEQLSAFYAALTSTLQRADGDLANVESAWDAAIQQHPEAAAVDRGTVLGWLRSRIDGRPGDQAAERTKDDAAPWPCEIEQFVLAGLPGGRDGEPVAEWLFSSEARWVKTACAAAMVALCVVTVSFERESGHRNVRDTAFARLQEARTAGDYVRMMDAAETFLGSGVTVADARESEVKAAYSEALVRWATEDTPSDQAERRAARYRTLVLEPAAGGSRQ
jgi:hypothetical protein